jgi:hypothetical protein
LIDQTRELKAFFSSELGVVRSFFSGEMGVVRSEMGALSQTIPAVVDFKLTELITRLEHLEAENGMLRGRISELEARAPVIGTLERSVAMLQTGKLEQETRDDLKEQTAKLYNVEIRGVHQTDAEQLPEIIKQIAKVIGCDLNINEVDFIVRTRTRNKNSPRPIIVKFLRRMSRDTFLAQVRAKKKRITTKDIGVEGLPTDIIVSEHLTIKNKMLFYQTRLLAKEKQYKFAWTRNGKIFLRKDEGTHRIFIGSEKDLETIK